jgi:hypothetical protein
MMDAESDSSEEEEEGNDDNETARPFRFLLRLRGIGGRADSLTLTAFKC